MTTDVAPPAPGPALAPPAANAPTSRRRFIVVGVGLALVSGAAGYYLHTRHFEDTDDAQIDGEIANVSPRIAGTLVSIKVSDNLVIKAGDLIAEIDPT